MVYYPDTDINAPRPALPVPCFFCHENIGVTPYIGWLGTEEVWLHPECTVELCLRLLRDVHEIECRTGFRLMLEPPR